mmetsp:Transcript_5262/g.15983  ORF Transcript_5262/g.15983 Transcript_5262/m.15983 type:complete len:1099 (+) Transcript_5262:49-3345(+)
MAAAAAAAAGPAAEEAEAVFYYTASCHRPTIVTHSIKAAFTDGDDINLIVAKVTTLEIYRVAPEGLQPVLDSDVYGRIAVMLSFRLPGESKDLLFVCTEANRYFILEFEGDRLITRAYGDVESRAGRSAQHGQCGFVDPEGRLLGLHLYEGQLKVIPITPRGQFKPAFDIKLEELQVMAIECLHGAAKPTIVLLHEERYARLVKTYTIELREKALKPGPWSQADVGPRCLRVVAMPRDPLAALAIGEVSVAYYRNGEAKVLPIAESDVTAHAVVDDGRVLLGSRRGEGGLLSMLVIKRRDGGRVEALEMEDLGKCSVPSAVAYLDEGVVHVGSIYGDSQLVQLRTEPLEDGTFVEELDRYTNLGPILDFAVVDVHREQQNQVITCSGAYDEGSLRVVRNGIGIAEVAQLEMPGVQGVWSLRASIDDEHHSVLAFSLVGQTAFLSVASDDELETIAVPGASPAESLHCGNAVGGCWVQVVQEEVLLLDAATREAKARWSPPGGGRISVCGATASHVAIACGADVWYLGLGGAAIEVVSHTKLEHDVACLSMTPQPPGAEPTEPTLLLAGLWTDITMRMLQLPGLNEVFCEPLGGDVIPRSAVLAPLEGTLYAFCALGDGTLFSFNVDPALGALTGRRRVTLGTKPISLYFMQSRDRNHIFAASDRPTVIYSSNGKLIFSHVNFSEVTRACLLNTESFPNSLVLVGEEGLVFGTIDDIQKLQVRTVPLGEAPYRIAYQEETRTVAVLTQIEARGGTLGHIQLVDCETFDVLDSLALDDSELPMSVASITLEGVDGPVYCVGTATMREDDEADEATSGQIILVRIIEGKLHVTSRTEVDGAVYTILGFGGKVLAGINSKVVLMSFEAGPGDGMLKKVCGHYGHVAVLCMKTRGDYILVGDLMRSMTVLLYRSTTNKIEELAADEHPHWMTAVEFADEYNFVGSEDSYNLFTCRRAAEATSEDRQRTLQTTGEFHVGQFINGIRPGTLATQVAAGEGPRSMIFCTQGGSIGTIVTISRADFSFLNIVQDKMAKAISGVGNLEHCEWREFRSTRLRAPARGFIDGDLIEKYLDLPSATQESIMRGVGKGERLIQILEDLGRLN